MEQKDNSIQTVAVEKVLEEMHKAEEFVKSWNASWWEEKLDAHCLPLHYDVGEADVRKLEHKYGSEYKLANAFYSGDSIGMPLSKDTLIGNNTSTGEKSKSFDVEFGRIDWHSMNSHKSIRHFSFNNDGIIEFSKNRIMGKSQILKNSKRISYDTSFDVLSNDFNVSITIDHLKYDYITLSLKNNVLIEKFNDIEIILNLTTGKKLVRIVKKYDKRNPENNASVVFEALLNSDESLELAAAAIDTHKGNGKINGTYRFDVSKKKGVRVNFYSRKGIKINLNNNPALLGTANQLLLQSQNKSSGDMIIADFINSTQLSVAKNLSEKVISFDNSDFNMESVNQAEKRIIEMIKCIKGELPLLGLVERIDICLDIIDNNRNQKLKDQVKKLTKKDNK